MNDSQWSGFELVSDNILQTIQAVNNGLLGTIVATFGIFSNIINIAVFLKQGFNDNVNISLLALSISDLGGLITIQWVNLLWNPLFIQSGAPFVPDEVMHLSGGWPNSVFVRITSLITVFITFERCLCVMLPLKVKTILTHRRTFIIIVSIYTCMLLTIVPEIATAYIGWKFYPEKNQTLIGMTERGNRGYMAILSFVLSGVTQELSLLAVIVLTILLVVTVKRKLKWRHSSSGSINKESATQRRDNRTVRMIIYVAIIFIICLLPSVNYTITTIVPEYRTMGKYHNAFFTGWSFAFLIQTINSSVNIFVYYKMSTKYRQTFLTIFSCCKCSEKKEDGE